MEYETPNGKGILIIRSPFGRYKIKFHQGGELPEELTGEFMRVRDADKAIAQYLDKVTPEKKATNGKGSNRTAN